MNNKRGLSAVVTTLIIILLVLVAVGIIWFVIKNILSGGAEEIFLGKFTVDLKIKNVNVDNSTNNVSLRIKRNPGKGDLTGIKLIFNDGINSEVFEQLDLTLVELGEKSFSFILTILDASNLKTVSIAPIYITDSGRKIVGRVIHTYTIGVGGECITNCTGKECGSDDCGGLCPPGCGTGYYCNFGTCVAGTPPCQLTSGLWSDESVIEGTTVTLNVVGTSCAGIDLNYSIYEDDLVGDDFVASFISTSLSPTWISQWIDDGVGDPEYYFVVTVVDNPTEEITSSDPLLTVTQGTLPPTNESNVARGFSSTTISTLSTIDVTLDVSIIDGETFYAIEEYIPIGWNVTNDGGGLTGDPNRLAWAVISNATDITYTYTVQAPASTGSYDFSGDYMFEGDTVTTTTSGQTTVTVI